MIIRGSFRGFISGWPGVVLITIGLLSIMMCFCCWCASIFYERSKRGSGDDEITDDESPPLNNTYKSTSIIEPKSGPPEIEPQEMELLQGLGQTSWVPPTEPIETDGICPYPIDPSLDRMPRPIV